MVAVIDYDAGNIKSVEKALHFLGTEAVVTREKETILNSSHVILPGVGAFGDAMEKIRYYNLESVIQEVVERGNPFLGICLGMQLLFASSEETKGVKGLNLLEGSVKHFPETKDMKIPHMGWNSLELKNRATLFDGLEQEPYVYFVHSYYVEAKRAEDIAAISEYGVSFHAAVERENIFGCQFHPEKSSQIGLTILKNFLAQGGR